jgi:hypothetical protein
LGYNRIGHVQTRSESEGTRLFIHVEELHCRWTHVVPLFISLCLYHYRLC